MITIKQIGIILSLIFFMSIEAHALCRNSIFPSTETTQFKINGDGSVTHNKTGLMWAQCSQGLGGTDCRSGAGVVPFQFTFSWSEALTQTRPSFYTGDHNDWRLPNLKELTSIVEVACFDPAINETVFPNTAPDRFWTSTPLAGPSSPDSSWLVDFFHGGSVSDRTAFGDPERHRVRRVRLVRDAN